jgi:hypothetical protein
MRSDVIEDMVVRDFKAHFKSAVDDFVVKESTDVPHTLLSLNMTVYNYFVVRLVVERGAAFASIVEAESHLQLLKMDVSGGGFELLAAAIDGELRLRIPERYLVSKGWGDGLC